MSVTWMDRCGRMTVEVTAVHMGNDLCLIITGGDRPHVGAVAVAQARPSLEDPKRLSASTSVITLLGHKEDLVASKVAQCFATKLNKNVVVCCGIHVDDITPDELKFVGQSIDQFCQSNLALG